MSVDLEALTRQCLRWRATPDFHSSEMTAFALLSIMPVDPRVQLQWAVGRDFQLSISGKVVLTASFEDCVTELAARTEK